MKTSIRNIALAAAAATSIATGATGVAHATAVQHSRSTGTKPTIVLVHGAFADSSSWSTEITTLQRRGYPVVAVANPLRGVANDAAYLESVLKTINGPIVLVGHSYAGFVVSQAAAHDPNVKALVYVAAYIPVKGETAADLTSKNPGSLLGGSNVLTRATPTGTDIYVQPSAFGKVYAGGLSRNAIRTAAVVQRPIAQSAFADKATVDPPASVPKWEIVATDDNAIPTLTQFEMADRAKAHIVTTRSGHDVPQARPQVVDRTILAAARTVN